MCMFSGEVDHVLGTQIFARASGDDPLLVYSMALSMSDELAMVLPLPTPTGARAEFIDASDSPNFFARLDAAFPHGLVLAFDMPPSDETLARIDAELAALAGG